MADIYDIMDELIAQSKFIKADKKGGNNKCFLFGNYALIEGQILEGTDKLIKKQANLQANIAKILAYQIEDIKKYERYQVVKGYVLQEKASGKEIYDRNIFRRKELDKIAKRNKELSKIPQEHFDKFVKDVKELNDNNIPIDTSKVDNCFYDKEKGFTFIDLIVVDREVSNSIKDLAMGSFYVIAPINTLRLEDASLNHIHLNIFENNKKIVNKLFKAYENNNLVTEQIIKEANDLTEELDSIQNRINGGNFLKSPEKVSKEDLIF